MDTISTANLSRQDPSAGHAVCARALVIGEVLWDVFPDATRLGGAALNFEAHLSLLGHVPRVVSAVGQLFEALPDARRFYDINLRPGFESRELVRDLLHHADIVKVNKREQKTVSDWLELPADLEGFCRTGAARFDWQAACVTLGARGCAMLVGDDYVEAAGAPVEVADTVGAGDAFAAAFVHGLVAGWPARNVAEFANRAGAAVAGAKGAIPGR